MPRYRTRAVELDAIRFTGDPSNFDDVCKFLGAQQHGHREEGYGPDAHLVLYYPGTGYERVASVGDWVVRDKWGFYDVYAADVFTGAYEAV